MGIMDVSRDDLIEALKTVIDPEVMLDIWFMGLIYSLEISDEGRVAIDMTFTTPLCPAGPQLVDEVKQKVASVSGVSGVDLQVVFTPPWQPSDEVKALLGMI